MLIDWFTVIAQIFNFLVLLWLLKRFLYQPVLNAIDTREKRIADQLADASSKEAAAQRQLEDLQRKNEEFESQREALLAKAVKSAHDERQKLLEEARKEIDLLRSRGQEMLRNERRSLDREIIRRAQTEVFAIARKALAELAGVSLEPRMVEVFVNRLRQLNGEAKNLLASALALSPRPVLVRSTFELAPPQRQSIEAAIRDTFATGAQIQFETTPELVSGIQLSANGQKVEWSIDDYLASLEKSIGSLLESKAMAATEADQHAA